MPHKKVRRHKSRRRTIDELIAQQRRRVAQVADPSEAQKAIYEKKLGPLGVQVVTALRTQTGLKIEVLDDDYTESDKETILAEESSITAGYGKYHI